jgi:hypothetical protein
MGDPSGGSSAFSSREPKILGSKNISEISEFSE